MKQRQRRIRFGFERACTSEATVWCVQFGVFVDNMLGNTTGFLLVALAAERYVAVVHPFTLQKRRASARTCSAFCVLLTWALATVLAVPDIFAHGMEDLVFVEYDADGDGMFALWNCARNSARPISQGNCAKEMMLKRICFI